MVAYTKIITMSQNLFFSSRFGSGWLRSGVAGNPVPPQGTCQPVGGAASRR